MRPTLYGLATICALLAASAADPRAALAQWADPVQRNITDTLTHGQRAIPVDIEPDGDLDIIASYSLADAVYLLINRDGAGGDWLPVEIASSFVAMHAIPFDADGDGDLDIAAVELFDRNLGFESSGRLAWYERPADFESGAWTERVVEDSLVHPIFLDSGDIDGDGDADLVAVTASETADNAVVWYENRLNEAAGGWRRWTIASGGAYGSAGSVRLADLDADGQLEAAAADERAGRVIRFDSGGNPRSDNWNASILLDNTPGAASARPADMDGDGDLDILAAFLDAQWVAWLENPGDPDAAPWTAHPIAEGIPAKEASAADLNGDGYIDVAFGSPEAAFGGRDLIAVVTGFRGGAWVGPFTYNYPSFTSVETGDVNGDGPPDLITSSYNGNRVDWWETIDPMAIPTPAPTGPPALGTPTALPPTATPVGPPPTSMPPDQSDATVLLYSPMDGVDSIANPPTSPGGTSSLLESDFVSGWAGNGVNFARPGNGCSEPNPQWIAFPAEENGNRAIELDRGEIEFWHRPNYAAGANEDTTHMLVYASPDRNGYNPPILSLYESDQLWFAFTDAGWNGAAVSGGYHAPLWDAGEWVHIRAAWDSTDPNDSLRLYVNGVRVDEGGAPGGWSLGEEGGFGLYVGSQGECGEFVADGVIDEFAIRSAPRDLPPPTPGQPTPMPPTATPPPNAAPTPFPGPPTPIAGGGVIDPNAVLPPEDIPLPPVGVPFTDPAFGTTLVRLTDATERGGFAAHVYSQLQAFSYDSRYILLTGSDGYRVMRLEDYSYMEGIDTGGWNNPRWHPGMQQTIVHFDTNADTVLRLQFTNVETGATETAFTFPAEYERIRVNQSFDELSEDGRWLAGMATISGGARMIFALDIESRALGAQLRLEDLYADGGLCRPDPQWGLLEPDWIGVSPLGNYLVIQWQRDWGAGADGECNGLETYDIRTGEYIGRVYDGHQHGDLGLSADGEAEIFFTSSFNNPFDNNRPAIVYHELPGPAGGFAAPEFLLTTEWGVGEHLSARGPAGSVLVGSGMTGGGEWFPFRQEVFFLNTDGSVRRLAHTRSSSCGYWVQPRASASRDGRYVIFDSDWAYGTGGNSCVGDYAELGQGEVYLIDLRAAPQTGVDDWPVRGR